MEGLFDYSLRGLILASFLAATIVPFSSEDLLSPYRQRNGSVYSCSGCLSRQLRANIFITAIAILTGKFLRYIIWGLLTGLVF